MRILAELALITGIIAACTVACVVGAIWIELAKRQDRGPDGDCTCGCDVYDQDAWTEADDTAVEQMMRGRWT